VDPVTNFRGLSTSQLSSDRGVSALLNNYKTSTPLVLILGNKCQVSPTHVPHRYCVMDWFRITAAWVSIPADFALICSVNQIPQQHL